MHLPRRHILQALAAIGAGAWATGATGTPDDPDERLQLGPARVDLHFDPVFDPVARARLRAWVLRSAACVADYLGRFPGGHSQIFLVATRGDEVHGGRTYNAQWPTVNVQVGRRATESRLRDDWIMVHEMVHLALPEVEDAQRWFHEGTATYVEVVARARAGLTTPEAAWAQLLRRLPLGLPRDNDRGLDFTPTWGRTYWGGALFCLLADVALRERTDNRMGLQQALAGLVAAGSDYGQDWSFTRILDTADQATGTRVLSEQYARMKDQPARPDLPALWARLGVAPGVLDDAAPLAAVRRAITG